MEKKNNNIVADRKKVALALYQRIEKTVKEDRKKRELAKKLAAAVVASMALSSCTTFGASQMFADSEEGFVMVAGNAEGIRAYNDGIIGVIADTKASPDVKSAYWQNRESETSVRMMRTQTHLKSYSAKREAAVKRDVQY